MKFMLWNERSRWIRGIAGILVISALAGCDRDGAKVYRIPKEDAPPADSAPAADATPADATAPSTAEAAPTTPPTDMAAPTVAPTPAAPIKYVLPPGWKDKPPSDMRVASLDATGPNGEVADIGVIPLGIVGRDMELVNMWRSNVQLPPTNDPDAVKQFEPVTIGGEQGRLFGYVSEQAAPGKAKQRILVATVTRGTMSWFFKMAGDDAYVLSQKKNFVQFLKSVSFGDDATAQPASPAPAGSASDAGSIWTVPSGWQSVPPSQFLLVEYAVPGANGAKAEVNVAMLNGEGGGLAANVNRWRGQIGLAPASDDDLQKLAQPLDVPGGKATLVDLTGVDAKASAPTRLVGVVVVQNGQTWFYKLMGDKQVVAQQKDAFTKFVQSANYANAR
jgi:hypothetical protein